eukprot:GHVR01001463.1.p1 GENE.GHVR01001463.1~~GHVR01001463.1.p1  ORF type:complete len:156 (+),score=38.97 GHVR01001463.1:154-621(+)
MRQAIVGGSYPALVTPMKENGDIDIENMKRLIDWQISEGTTGLVVLGTTGECPSVDANEFEIIVKETVTHVGGRVPVIVGTGTNCTRSTILKTKKAEELGADAAMLVVPYYNKPSQEGITQHFLSVSKNVSLPLLLYNECITPTIIIQRAWTYWG